MGELSPWHWAIVILIAVLLFGSRRLPDAARSLGRSARILKAELREGAAPPPAPGEAPYAELRDGRTTPTGQRDGSTAPAQPHDADRRNGSAAAAVPDERPRAEVRDGSTAMTPPRESSRSDDRG